jgi:hypothetical protein
MRRNSDNRFGDLVRRLAVRIKCRMKAPVLNARVVTGARPHSVTQASRPEGLFLPDCVENSSVEYSAKYSFVRSPVFEIND